MSEDVGAIAASSSRLNHKSKREAAVSEVAHLGAYRSTCGYCKATSRTSVAQGLWAYTLRVHDYQALLDRGWRRSGMSVYKPNMQRTCCPAYTIRLEVDAFSPSKDQARVLRRMQRYLDGTYEGPVTVGEIQKDDEKLTSQRPGKVTSNSSPATPSDKDQSVNEKLLSNGRQNSGKKRQPDVLDESGRKLSLAIQCSIAGCVELGVLSPDFNQQDVTVRKFAEKAHGKLKDLDGQVEYTSNVAFAIAAAMKRKRNGTVQIDQRLGVDNETGLSKEEFLPEHIAEILASRLQHSDLCGLIVQACKGHLNFLMSESKVGSDTSSPMEVSTSQGDLAQGVHQCEPRKQSLQEVNGQKGGTQKLPIVPRLTVKTRQMEIKMQKSAFDAEEFALYKKYQIIVHNDRPEEVNENSYRGFLVDTPLISVPPESNGSTPACGFGSFHQQYRIDGKLVAVGVVDILPHCLSSKYLFWDPDLSFLSLGKYSALSEIKWVQEASKVCPSLKYYYLGYYIHSCPKMRYKAAYAPSELLCPVRYTWVPYNLVRSHLDDSPFVCLSDVAVSKTLASETGGKVPPSEHEDKEEIEAM